MVRLLSVAVVLLGVLPAFAEPFQETVRPFVNTYCVACHNKEKAAAELDLSKFDSAAKLVADFRAWEHVLTFVRKEEMPPKKAKQPTPKERAELLATLEKVLHTEAKKLAGEPGLVPPRRLSNAEYDYTIHDLTGVDIRPAKAFPVDPASGEGFNNTGEALTMSPALFKKYYAAAEFVADHAALTTKGLAFAPHPVVTFADRQKYAESAIIRFYEQHAVDYERYFRALQQHQQDKTPLAELAKQQGLSVTYLQTLADVLLKPNDDAYLLRWLRARWAALPAKDAGALRALAADIQLLSKQLTPKETEAIVANAGNGPIDHLARRGRTAATRDTFNRASLEQVRLEHEWKNVLAQETLTVVLRVEDFGTTKKNGTVLAKAIFTTNSATQDGQKFWSLKRLLQEVAPKELDKLTFGKGPRNESDWLHLKETVTLTIPTTAFNFKDKKANVTFIADCEPDKTAETVAMVQLLDHAPKDTDAPLLRPLVDPKHPAATKYAASANAFCKLFPSRFFYVDSTRGLSAGFHLIEGFFRDDQPLCRSVLTPAEKAELDRLWAELYFVTGIWEKMLRGFVFFERSERNFLKHRDFDPFKEEDPDLTRDEVLANFQDVYLKRSNVKLTGDALAAHPINVFFNDVRNGLKTHAKTLQDTEAMYLRDVQAFAAKAYRRPLTDVESAKVLAFFTKLARDKDHGVEQAVRASLVRVLVSPHFCFLMDDTPPGDGVAPLSDLALASRLSYFLWSSTPDAELLQLAATGKLKDDATLKAQVARMLQSPKASRFVQEFFGQWLGYRDFLTQEAVNRQVFPMFDDSLKQAMFEEPTRLATYLLQQNQPITRLLDSDTTFVNRKLAAHYGVPFKGAGDDWEKIDGLHAKGRAGLFGMAVILTKNSQPQRTSPVKRGFWVVHKLLGEHIPPPPPDVAVLPAKETDTNGKTIRQLLALHTTDAKCAACHQRFDHFGLAMEGFDMIGRSRTKDFAGRVVDTVVQLTPEKQAKGVPAFAEYLAKERQTDFTKTLNQKLVGYALGRSLQLSDQVLLDELHATLNSTNDNLARVVERIVLSPQFRTQRCQNFTPTKFTPPSPPDRGLPK